MNSVVEYLYKQFEDEVEPIRNFLKESIAHMECSTSIEDCLFLYLLIRYYKPKTILEIGTFVGSTLLSMVKACEKNDLDYKIYTIDLEDSLKVSLTETEKKHISFLHCHSDIAVNMISEHLDFIFADADLTVTTANKLAPLVDETTIFATHDFVPPLDKGITSLINIFEYSTLKNNHILVPNENINWIYHSKWKESYHDSFTKVYLKDRDIICNRVHTRDINCCIALILPQSNKNIMGYTEYFDMNNVYIEKIDAPFYYYDGNDGCIIINNQITNNMGIMKANQIVCELKEGLPKFIGILK